MLKRKQTAILETVVNQCRSQRNRMKLVLERPCCYVASAAACGRDQPPTCTRRPYDLHTCELSLLVNFVQILYNVCVICLELRGPLHSGPLDFAHSAHPIAISQPLCVTM